MSKGRIAIFDMDDTLSVAKWREHLLATPKEGRGKNWDAFFGACEDDPCIYETINLAKDLQKAGVAIGIFTGRFSEFEVHTRNWLKKHDIDDVSMLKMRDRKGKFMRSGEMKRAWLEEIQRDGWVVVFVMDDDVSVREALPSKGIFLFPHQTDEARRRVEGMLSKRKMAM